MGVQVAPQHHKGYMLDNYNMTNLFFGGNEWLQIICHGAMTHLLGSLIARNMEMNALSRCA